MTIAINGIQCSKAEATVPRFGAMWCRAEFADAKAAPAKGSAATLVIAGITFACTVTDSGDRGGVFAVELTGGAGGWAGFAPAPAGYRNDAGQRLSEVVTKLSEAVGETVILGAGVDRSLGALVAVAGGPGAPSSGAVLSQLCRLPEGSERIPWHVDPAGITRLGPRLPLGEIAATEVDSGPRREWVAYAEEDASLMLPGATVDGREIAELRIEAEPGHIREVVTFADSGPAGAHTLSARMLRWVLDIARPLVLWRGIYTYRITGQTGSRFNAVPVSSKIAPALSGLRFWPGAAGHSTTVTTGARCLVAFADGNPNAPVIVAWMPRDDDKGKPGQIVLDATAILLGPLATRGIARLGDTVLCTLPPAVLNGLLNGVTPISGAVVFSGSAMGTIQSASTKASSE
jgi:hypothetical protein